MICYHHNDLDGRCAAAIVLKEYPDCRMREIDYGDNPIFEDDIHHEGEKVFIVDFSFKPKKMHELFMLVAAKNVTWIDHHETAKEYTYKTEFADAVRPICLSGLRDFSQECKKSGCELTWAYLFPSVPPPEAVRLLGDYDCWRFDTKEDSLNFQFGMRSERNEPTNIPLWQSLFEGDGTLVDSIKNTGKAIVNYKTNISRQILQNGYNLEFEGHICFVVNAPGIDSGMFELHGCKEDYGFFISWVYLGNNYRVSLKSINKINVAKIAKKYGGGGHKGAAGFVCDKLPF